MARTDHALPGIYNSTVITIPDGSGSALSTDSSGNAKTAGYSYTAISTATTTTVKSGKGVLKAIIVTGGTAGTIDIYDNTAGSGTVICSIGSTNTIADYQINASFSTGLTVVTAAATKLTVIYD